MSTVKISQLPFITELNANTEKTLMAGVDLPSGLTGKISMRTLAARLYSNDVLNVGTNPIILDNVVAQFTESSSEYIQINLQNFDGVGSSDYVASANNSNGANNFVDMGINGPGFNDPDYSSMLPYDSYVYAHGPSEGDYRGNLVIGTASANAHVKFIAGGTLEENIVGQYNHSLYEFYNPISVTGDIVNTGNVYTTGIRFGDGSIQEGSSVARLNAAFLKANNALANTGNAIFGHHLTIPDTLTANLMIVTGLQEFSGNALIRTATGTGNFKNISLLSGDEISTGDSGSIDITTGSSGAVSGYSGDIVLNIGEGTTGNGQIYLNGTSQIGTGETITYLNGDVRVGNNLTWGDGSYIDLSDKLNIASTDGLEIKTNLNGATKSWNFAANGDLTTPGNVTTQTITTQNSIVFFDGSSLGYNPAASPATLLFSTANNLVIETNDGASGFSFNSLGFSSSRGITSSGNTNLLSYVSIIKSDADANTPVVQITSNEEGTSFTPSNSHYILQLTGKQNTASRLVIDSFGQNSYPVIVGRMARGTPTEPLATANNDVLMRIVGNGYTGTQFSPTSPTKIDFVATEDFNNTSRGTEIQFWNTTKGSNTLNKIASFNANEAIFDGVLIPAKGFIFTPRVLPGSQTAITIDFSSDSTVKASIQADCTLSFINYTYGKVVEVWLTNTSGLTRTVTHGCSATNSSENSTTFTMPSTSSAYIKYFSIDGDLANTFVTVMHA